MLQLTDKQWEAAEMVPPKAAGRIVGNLGKEYIGLTFSSSGYTEGEIIKLNDGNAADVSMDACLALGQLLLAKYK